MTSLVLQDEMAVIGGEAWRGAGASDSPLVVALHGGGFTRAYYTAGASLPRAARDAGLDVVLLDRPGAGDSRFHTRRGDILTDNAQALSRAIETLWGRVGADYSGVFLVGHSIGGAITLLMAATRQTGPRTWPLAGVSVSGVGDRPPVGMRLAGLEGPAAILSRAAMAKLFLAPSAVGEAALDAMQSAAIPAVREELASIYTTWPAVAASTLAAITAPIQLILAEHETLWDTGQAAADRLAGAMTGAARTDVAVWPGVGHCAEHHPQAPAFFSRIFQFAA